MIKLSGLIPEEDIKIVETGPRPGEKLYEELLSDKEVDLPTPNEKIRIAQVRKYDYNTVLDEINYIKDFAEKNEIELSVQRMKILVPEFISNNSVFEAIDKKNDLISVFSDKTLS